MMSKKCHQYIAHGKECPLVYLLYSVFSISVLFVNVFEKFFRSGHKKNQIQITMKTCMSLLGFGSAKYQYSLNISDIVYFFLFLLTYLLIKNV